MDKISRTDAAAQSLANYFTGEPCPHGHVSERRVINRACCECSRVSAKKRYEQKAKDPAFVQNARGRAAKWAAENPERYAARQAEWRESHKDDTRAYNAAYRDTNKERISEGLADKRASNPEAVTAVNKRRYENETYAEEVRKRSRQYRKENRELVDAKNKIWRANNPDAIKSIQRAGWINRRARERAVGKITAADVRTVRGRLNCEACGQVHQKMEIDHILALSRGGTNGISNLQLLCQPCNRSKWANDHDAWLAEKIIS